VAANKVREEEEVSAFVFLEERKVWVIYYRVFCFDQYYWA